MTARFARILFLTPALLLAVAIGSSQAVPLVAVDFGGTFTNSPLQPGFQGMWGTNDAVTTATLGDYTIKLSADSTQTGTGSSRGFFHKAGGRIDNTDATIRDFYRDFYYNRSTVNGEGINLQISGLTPNATYDLTLVSFDPDASTAVPTVTNWGPESGSNTTGTTATINMLREPVPMSLWDPLYSGTIQVSTSTGVLDIFGTTSAGARGAVLNGFKLNDGVGDVLVADLGEGAPAGNVQPGYVGMIGPEHASTQSQVVGAYTITVDQIGGSLIDGGFWNERTGGQAAENLSPPVHALYRDYYYNNSTAEGDGVLLTIDGVTPNTEYDLKIWTYDPANANLTPTVWSPVFDTTGETGNVVNFRTPIPQQIDDPNRTTTIRVTSTSTKLEIFGTTTMGFGGTRLNAIELSAVSAQVLGDYNGNGVVDAADYTVWRDSLDSTTNLAADGSGNEIVDQADYDFWKQHFGEGGTGSSLGATAVPEPTSLVLLLSIAVVQFLRSPAHGRRSPSRA